MCEFPRLQRRKFILAALGSLLIVAGNSQYGLAQSGEPLRFGLANPLTGPSAPFGTDQVKAVEWAVEDINAAGGVNGRPLELIVLDTQGDPQVGINAVNRLVSVEEVPAFITAFSAVVKAVAPIANRSKTLMLSVGANAPAIKDLGDYVFTTFPLSDVDVTALTQYTYEELGKRRAAIMYINNESGADGAEIYRDSFTEAGGEVVAFEAYDPAQTDFTGMILKVRAADPDIIHVHGLISDFTQVVAQMRQLGLNQRVSSYSAAYNTQMIEQLGESAEDIIVTSLAPGVEDNNNLADYIERWKEEEGRIPNGLPYTQYFYDAPYIIAECFKWVLDNDLDVTGENMRKALLEIKTFEQPLTNQVVINADHTVSKPVYLATVTDGEFVPLATIE